MKEIIKIVVEEYVAAGKFIVEGWRDIIFDVWWFYNNDRLGRP